MSSATILDRIRGRSTAFAPLGATLIHLRLTPNHSHLKQQTLLMSALLMQLLRRDGVRMKGFIRELGLLRGTWINDGRPTT